MCALSTSTLIPIENFKALFLGFLFLRFLHVACKIKKKLNKIATKFQLHYLQFCFLLSVNQKGLSKKMFKRIWQVVETIFLPQKSLFLLTLAKMSNFSFFFRILLVQVEKNYTKNNDLQYFLFQIKMANAILHADEVLQRRDALRDSLKLGL